MSLSDDLDNLVSAGPSDQYVRASKGNYPKGWEPRIEYDPREGGEFISSARAADDASPDEAVLFSEFELDPTQWTVLNMRRSRWQRHDGEWLEAFRCSFAPRGRMLADSDLDTIIAEIRADRPTKKRPTGDVSFLALSGDQQIGKPDGDGTRGTVQRILTKSDAAVEQLQLHLSNKLPIGTVYLPQLGDCIEGYNSQGGKNMWRNELTLTQMIRVYRRLLTYQIKAFAPHAERIVVPILPGNHDEAVRVGNQMATTYTDSWAIEAASAVQDALAENPKTYEHVHFVFPEEDELTITLNISGTVCGFAHGHQFGRDPLKWWAGQSHGRQPIGDADVLFGAHLHHFHAQYTGGGKTFIRLPSLDGGSTWFRHRTGESAAPGLVTLTMDDSGWNNLVLV